MGFPGICYCVVLPRPLILLALFLDSIKQFVSDVLRYLGLLRPSDDLLSAASHLPALPMITPDSIKARLPAVEFASFARGSAATPAAAAEGDDEVAVCAVCLRELEARDEVRELGNCCHAFHKGCIDKWVDVGQVTCPLCRSQLLPPEKKGRRLLLVF